MFQLQTNAQNVNDQVVPSMSASTSTSASTPASAPTSGSRKRRRSTEKLLNEISHRGISVQHVANDARQLNSNDIGQLQHLFRNRNRFGGFQQIFPMRSAMSTSSINSNSTTANQTVNRNRSPGISDFIRYFRIRDIQTSDSNRNLSASIARSERSAHPTNGLNMIPDWQFPSVNRTTLSDLYRCAVTSRGQQASEASRQNDQLRLIRRIRRARSSTNNHSSR